jgi:hypothetical protein
MGGMVNLEFHPIADLFPMIEGEDFRSFVADLKAHGLREPIVLFEEKILDGRNRYLACIEAEVEPHFLPYQGTDPVAYVLSLNLKRRHLTESQCAMVAAKVANMRQGERTDLTAIAVRLRAVSQAD